MSELDFESLLNDEQRAAALAPDGPILVLAAAGTGKTRTLVFRVAHLVQRGVSAENILLLTFTNKAAREMLLRARELVGDAISGIWGGTFHHMANRILRRHAGYLGYDPDYTILDRDDSKTLIGQCLKRLDLVDKEFPKPTVLMGLFSSAANSETSIAGVLETRYAEFDASEADLERARSEYTKRKKELGAMDFDDLLVNCLELFRNHKEVSERYQEQFAHILVDEYQDTNCLQAELVDRMASRSRNLLVVGDDFQSIYSWRGADFKNIISFPSRYEGAQTYKLETNYRSVPQILDVANACIKANPEQFQKELRATREAGAKPSVARLRDGDEQARYVVERIQTLRREGHALDEIAILYRAHYHALELERMLSRAQVPYVIVSGIRFFEQAHIKDVCCLLRLLVTPHDELAFTRLFRLLPGVGEQTAIKLWNAVGGRCDLRDPGSRETLSSTMKPAARKVWAAVVSELPADAIDGMSGDQIIESFIQAFYSGFLQRTYEDSDRRLDDLSALADDVAQFDSMESFLGEVALMTNVDAEGETHEEEISVRLSTVHQAKGLEWPVVMILWATDGMFPSSRSLQESDDAEAEERRLFYVAITRAKDQLNICVPELRRMRDGGVMYCQPSRFVEEIPDELLSNEYVGFV
jgi:DNA helicase-2/ATP-dependent DNA helicase PcrA